MRDYGILRPKITTAERLADVSAWANVLYDRGLTKADNFGRLVATPFKLASDCMTALILKGRLTISDVAAAADELVKVGLWYRYELDGNTYIEYEDYDEEQLDDFLRRRGVKDALPDPPDRPDLWIQNRQKYLDNPRKRPAKAASESDPGASAVQTPPAEDASVASPPETQPPERDTAPPSPRPARTDVADQTEAFRALQRAHEQHSGRLLTTDDTLALNEVLKAAAEAGVEWQVLLRLMLEAQANYQGKGLKKHIERIRFYFSIWDPYIREALAELDERRGRQGQQARLPPPSEINPDHRRPLDTDHIE